MIRYYRVSPGPWVLRSSGTSSVWSNGPMLKGGRTAGRSIASAFLHCWHFRETARVTAATAIAVEQQAALDCHYYAVAHRTIFP